jgi:TPR repeat protein
MYEFGYGVPKDIPEALNWMKKAADQGLATAQARLGEIYFAGNETVQDFKAAREWLQKAADQHNRREQFHGEDHAGVHGYGQHDRQGF